MFIDYTPYSAQVFEHLGATFSKKCECDNDKQERKNEQETSDLYIRRSQTKDR